MKPRLRLFLALLVLGISATGWWFVSTTYGQLVQDVTYDSPAGRFTLPTKAGVVDSGFQTATLAYFFPSNVPNVGSLAGDTGNGFSDRFDFENLNAFGIQQAGTEIGDRDSLNPANQVLIGGQLKNPNFRFVHPGQYPYVWRVGQPADSVQTKEVTVFTSIDHLFDPEVPGYGPNRPNPPAGGLGNVVLEACEFTVFGTNDPVEAELASRTANYFGVGGTGTLPANGKWFRASLKYLIADGYKDFNGVSPLASQPGGAASPSPQESEDFSSQWEFTAPVKFVAVYANRTRDAKFFVPDSTGKVPGVIAQSDEAEIDGVGFIPFTAGAAASIRGRVINDANGNGRIDTGEQPLRGVTVTLFNGAGGQLAVAQTDPNGEYSFAQLVAGDYRVVQTNLPNYIDTGIIPGLGNRVSGLNTILATLAAGQASDNNIFLDGLPPPGATTCIPACYNSVDVWLLYDKVREQLYQKSGGVGAIFLLSLNRAALSDQEIVEALNNTATPLENLNAQFVVSQLNALSYPTSVFNRANCFFNGPNMMIRFPGNPRVIDLMNQARTLYGSGNVTQIRQVANQLELINNITATRGIFCPLADP